jgi:hypothetical protein
MAGLAPDAAHYFKFLLVLVLYAFAMTLFVGSSFSVLLTYSKTSAELPARLYIPQRRYRHSVVGVIQSIHDESVVYKRDLYLY